MIYYFPISIPKNTPIADLYLEDIKLTHGVIHKVEFLFPPGPVGLAGIAVFDAIHQVWPSNTGEFFSSDDETISYPEHLPLIVEPYLLTAAAYNLDDTFEHTITVRIGILPIEIIAPWMQSYDKRLLNILGGE